MKKKEDELLNSNYDGIQEYDNDLPKWWSALFIITIVYAVVYGVVFHGVSTFSSEEELKGKMDAIAAMKKAAPVHESSEASLLALVNNTERLTAGKTNFQAKCAPCHGDLGQGIVGPNLTDNYWIHGSKITDIRRTVEVGVADKGMVPWKGLMTDAELDDVSAYVFSLKGSNPPNPKPQEGTLSPES